jgi:hypothetical protein
MPASAEGDENLQERRLVKRRHPATARPTEKGSRGAARRDRAGDFRFAFGAARASNLPIGSAGQAARRRGRRGAGCQIKLASMMSADDDSGETRRNRPPEHKTTGQANAAGA